jgi:hypothetical protein
MLREHMLRIIEVYDGALLLTVTMRRKGMIQKSKMLNVCVVFSGVLNVDQKPIVLVPAINFELGTTRLMKLKILQIYGLDKTQRIVHNVNALSRRTKDACT